MLMVVKQVADAQVVLLGSSLRASLETPLSFAKMPSGVKPFAINNISKTRS